MPVHKDGNAVDHPSYYNSSPSGVECIEVVRHMSFNVGSAVKYLWRAGLKDANPSVQDLEKAIWYLQDEVARLQSQPEDAILDSVAVAATREASPSPGGRDLEGGDPPKIETHKFNPGSTGMSTLCNSLVIFNGHAEVCSKPGGLHLHQFIQAALQDGCVYCDNPEDHYVHKDYDSTVCY